MMTRRGSPVIVAGMHRSGTSLVASLLSSLSVDMGRHPLLPDVTNARGYFEDLDFLALQRRILSDCCPDTSGHPDWGWTEGGQLQRHRFREYLPQAEALIATRARQPGHWGWKDPRTTLLLDFWDPLLKDARYVLVYRFPWDVTDSMQRLGADVFLSHPEYAPRIWTFYNRHLRDFFSKNPGRCLLISVNALVRQPEQLPGLLRRKLGLDVPELGLEAVYEADWFTSVGDSDPLIDLVAATSPECIQLLGELDVLADLPGAERWRRRPVTSRLARPGAPAAVGPGPDLSVIIPCYDHGQFLIEAIAGVERAAPERCELIVVNDGSQQPRTLEILDVLRRCGYFVIDQPNSGLANARHAAIATARGRYILALDADNRIRPGFLPEAMRVLDSRPEVGVVYGDRYEFGLRTGRQHVPDFDLDQMLRGNYIDACAVFRRQVWIDCGGYDSAMTPLEDWELWINAAAHGWRFHRLPDVTFDYRVRPASHISRVDRVEVLRMLLERVMTKHEALYRSRWIQELATVKCHVVELSKEIRRLSGERTRLSEEHARLAKELAARDEHQRTLQAALTAQQQGADATIAMLASNLDEIRRSTAWSLVQRLWRLRSRLAPHGGRRERFGRWAMGLARRLGSPPAVPPTATAGSREAESPETRVSGSPGSVAGDGDVRGPAVARPMRFLRRRPTLEVHVPVSPTGTFLNMTHYLTRSLRVRGGRYRDAPIVLTVGASTRDPDLARNHPWMADNGVEVRWIDEALFARESWFATAAERFRYEFTSDVVLALDADTLIAGPLDELVEMAHRNRAVCGVVAHLPPLPRREQWQEIYHACGLGDVTTPCQHTGWGYMFSDESQRYCPPYFNLGVLAAPASAMRSIGSGIYDLMAAVDAVHRTNYRVQIAVSLAVARFALPFRTLSLRWNFANDPLLEALHGDELHDVRIIHLLRKHQIHKDELYASQDNVEAMLARTDLRVINALAQRLLGELHPRVKAEGAARPRG